MADIDLDDFGIMDGISETIVSTYHGWSPNAAPIGIIRKQGNVFVRLYKGSTTLRNVSSEYLMVANVIQDPLLFVRSTIGNLDDSEFEVISHSGRGFSVLKEAASWVCFECRDTKESSEAMIAKLSAIRAHRNLERTMAYNRGFGAVVEACVHATRYKLTKDVKYMQLITAYVKINDKCGGFRERKAMDMLLDHVNKI